MKIEETDERTDEDNVAVRRARARNLLPQIVQQVKQAFDEASVEIEVFVMIPATGDPIATFGTVIDPPDEVWARVSEIVCSVVQKVVGLERARCNALSCATTADQPRILTSRADCTSESQPIPAEGETR